MVRKDQGPATYYVEKRHAVYDLKHIVAIIHVHIAGVDENKPCALGSGLPDLSTVSLTDLIGSRGMHLHPEEHTRPVLD